MLHQTVKRVLRFAAKGLKSQEKFRSVRWLPASEIPGLGFSEGSWVMAYDGTVGVACHVEDVLPSVLLPTDGVRQALAAAVASVGDQGQSVAIQSVTGGTFQIPKIDPDGYPLPPVAPEGRPWSIWGDLRRVLHCAATADTGRPTFEHVCLRPTGAEVTDSVCVAEAPGWGWDAQVLLPAKMLLNAPASDDVSLAMDDQSGYVRFGAEEIRWGIARRDISYPDCRGVCQSMRARSHTVIVKQKALLEAVRQAVSISAANAVALVFHAQTVGLLGWRGAGEATQHQFDVTIPVVGGQPSEAPVAVYLDGRFLVRALRAVDTPCLEIGYSAENEPVCLAWASVTECIWPWAL